MPSASEVGRWPGAVMRRVDAWLSLAVAAAVRSFGAPDPHRGLFIDPERQAAGTTHGAFTGAAQR